MHSNKPVIGITLSQTLPSEQKRWPTRYEFDWLGKGYHYAIEKSGGAPFGLFNTTNTTMIGEYLERVDGLLFTGGADLQPKYFGQIAHPSTLIAAPERDSFELRLIREALRLRKPLFCICRGLQVLNTVLGGTLYQDLSLYPDNPLKHADKEQTGKVDHKATLLKGSLLHEIIGKTSILVNSSHHQFVKQVGAGLTVSALAPDGVIEAFELDDYPFLIGVQWHPERIFKRQHSQRLFSAFVEYCRKHA
jgi:putative glutamine amidotransferase